MRGTITATTEAQDTNQPMKNKEQNTTLAELDSVPPDMRECYVIREARCRMPQDGEKTLLHGVFNDDGNSLYHGSKQDCISYCIRLNLPHKVK